MDQMLSRLTAGLIAINSGKKNARHEGVVDGKDGIHSVSNPISKEEQSASMQLHDCDMLSAHENHAVDYEGQSHAPQVELDKNISDTETTDNSNSSNEHLNTSTIISDDDDDDEDYSDQDEEDDEDDSSEQVSWIQWFCSLEGHQVYCEVDEAFIEDTFNMTGLQPLIPYYEEALEMILDIGPDGSFSSSELQTIEKSAEMLYNLIHQRFITTRAGMATMYEKYTSGILGTCPRILCENQPSLLVGISDFPTVGTVKQFCPRCLDIYEPNSSKRAMIDGCAFGTTPAHLLINSFPDVFEETRRHWSSNSVALPDRFAKIYQPSIYGFRIHRSSETAPKMGWLRRMKVEPPETFDPTTAPRFYSGTSQPSLNEANDGGRNPLESD